MLVATVKTSTEAEQLKAAFTEALAEAAKSFPPTLSKDDVGSLSLVIPHLIQVATAFQNWLTDDDFIYPLTGLSRFYDCQGLYSEAVRWDELCFSSIRPVRKIKWR